MRFTCLNCHTYYEAERTDSKFCSGACKAAYYRTKGDTASHEDLDRMHAKSCEYCGSMFWFNAYAKRGGKRVPTYCRDSCRVAASRARKKDAGARAGDDWRKREEWVRQNYKAPNAPPKSPPKSQPGATGDDYYSRLTQPRRWSAGDAYAWLHVVYGSSEADCRKAFRDIMRKHHPDANGGAVWPYLNYVSAAFDYLKRKEWK